MELNVTGFAPTGTVPSACAPVGQVVRGVDRAHSQPELHELVFDQPDAQAEIPQVPPVHVAPATCSAAPPHVFALQAFPHPPQLPLSMLVLVEQLVPSPVQLA